MNSILPTYISYRKCLCVQHFLYVDFEPIFQNGVMALSEIFLEFLSDTDMKEKRGPYSFHITTIAAVNFFIFYQPIPECWVILTTFLRLWQSKQRWLHSFCRIFHSFRRPPYLCNIYNIVPKSIIAKIFIFFFSLVREYMFLYEWNLYKIIRIWEMQ